MKIKISRLDKKIFSSIKKAISNAIKEHKKAGRDVSFAQSKRK